MGRISRTIILYDVTAHIFRHTFAAVAASFLDINPLQSIMGHADIETTLDRYTHARKSGSTPQASFSPDGFPLPETDIGTDTVESPQSIEIHRLAGLHSHEKLTFHLTKRPKTDTPDEISFESKTNKNRNPLSHKGLRPVRPTGFEPATFRVGV